MIKNRIHPGQFLQEELAERGVSQTQLAKHIGVTPGVINQICNGRRGVSPEMAKKLAAALGTTAELWMTLQSSFNLSNAAEPDCGRLPSEDRLAPSQEVARGPTL